MINAMREFLDHVGGRTVRCAWIQSEHYSALDLPKVILKQKHTETEYLNFLNHLDFTYDDGYGTQHLEGVIWFTDGTWSTRGEYDGSEWWENNKRPPVPKELK